MRTAKRHVRLGERRVYARVRVDAGRICGVLGIGLLRRDGAPMSVGMGQLRRSPPARGVPRRARGANDGGARGTSVACASMTVRSGSVVTMELAGEVYGTSRYQMSPAVAMGDPSTLWLLGYLPVDVMWMEVRANGDAPPFAFTVVLTHRRYQWGGACVTSF